MEVPVVPHQARLIARSVRFLSLGGFAFYVFWNGVWIAKGRIPPSILIGIAGIPCPTTGGIRSILALCRGDWLQALLWNPFTLVYLLLFAYSLVTLLCQATKRERLALTPFVAWTWFISLALGWAAKFALGPKYW